MQSKGAIRFVAILLAIACIWQLSFTAVTRIQENKAAKAAQAQAEQFVSENNVAPEVREFGLPSRTGFTSTPSALRRSISDIPTRASRKRKSTWALT